MRRPFYATLVVLALGCAEDNDRTVPFIGPAPEQAAEAAPPPVVEEPEAVEAQEPPRVVSAARSAPERARVTSRPAPIAPRIEVAPRSEGASSVELARVVIAADVVDREPGAGPIQAGAERTYVFVEAANAGAPTELAIVFVEPNGVEGAPIALSLPTSPRWRTWATTRRTHGRPGAWTAIVRDAAGRELARRTFEVGPASEVAIVDVPGGTDGA